MSLISFAEVMNEPGIDHVFDIDIENRRIKAGGREGDIISGKPVHFVVRCTGERKVTFTADISILVQVPCDRCLEPVEIAFDDSQSYQIVFDENANLVLGDDDDEYGFFNGYNLDVDAYVNEEVVIGFPMKVLCSEECKGLCSVCGANLNKGECGCDRTVLDPRMSIIRDIFRQQGSPSDKEK